MRLVVTALVILLGIGFYFNYPVLTSIYKNIDTYEGFVPFYNARNIFNSAMFCLFFFTIYALTEKYPFAQSIAKFCFIGGFSSLFDVSIGVNNYLRSDILLLMIAFEISIFQYLFYEHRRRGKNIHS